jgi:IS605 OrfB family transposase
MPTITAKVQVYLNDSEKILFAKTMKAFTDACNFVSAHMFATRELKRKKLQDTLYRELRERFGLKSMMACSVFVAVMAKYKTVKSLGHEWTKVEFTKPTLDLVWNRDYSLSKDVFSVNTLEGRAKLRYQSKGMEKYFDGSWEFGTAKLVNKFGKWFLHIPVTKAFEQLQESQVNNVVGVDLGITFLATAYDSKGKTTFYSGKQVKNVRSQYKAGRKEMQQRRTPSARRRIKSTGQRENRYMADVNHCITKALVTKYPKGTLFVLEELSGVRNATERVRVDNRYVSVSWAFYQLRQMLTYKAELYGHKVIAVSPKYTSQTCPKCGHVEKANRNKKTHTFCCKNCAYTSNDDRVGAMNLYRMGINHLHDTGAMGHDPVALGVVSHPAM